MADLEVCGVCGSTREDHAQRRHQFNADGALIPLPGARVGQDKTKPPARAGSAADGLALQFFLRVVEVLTKKGLLTPEELAYIFGRPSDASDRGSNREAGPDRSASEAG